MATKTQSDQLWSGLAVQEEEVEAPCPTQPQVGLGRHPPSLTGYTSCPGEGRWSQ